MSATTVLVYLTLAEVGLLAIVASIFLIIRARKLKHAAKPATQKVTQTLVKTVAADIGSHINKLIQQTRSKLEHCDDNQTRFLEARLHFLEAEAVLLAQDPDADEYWQEVSDRLARLFPPSSEPQEDTALAELDALDELDELEPVEMESDAEDEDEKQKGSITIDTSQQELGRLRNIISRQHGAIDELKQLLDEKSESSEQAEKLAKKLEQIEVAHAQLNMCIDVLEKENTRLKQKLKKPIVDSDASQEELQETRKKLDIANTRIDDLEEENNVKTERINELETEISSLQTSLQEHKEALKRAELLSADLSRIDDEPETDPEVLKKQIEDITELLMMKSNELQQLQSTKQPRAKSRPVADGTEDDNIPVLEENVVLDGELPESGTDADSMDEPQNDHTTEIADTLASTDENAPLDNQATPQANPELAELAALDAASLDATVDEVLADLETYDPASDTASSATPETVAEQEFEIPIIDNLDDADIVIMEDGFEVFDEMNDAGASDADINIEDDINDYLRQQATDDDALDPEFLAALGLDNEEPDAEDTPSSQTG